MLFSLFLCNYQRLLKCTVESNTFVSISGVPTLHLIMRVASILKGFATYLSSPPVSAMTVSILGCVLCVRLEYTQRTGNVARTCPSVFSSNCRGHACVLCIRTDTADSAVTYLAIPRFSSSSSSSPHRRTCRRPRP